MMQEYFVIKEDSYIYCIVSTEEKARKFLEVLAYRECENMSTEITHKSPQVITLKNETVLMYEKKFRVTNLEQFKQLL